MRRHVLAGVAVLLVVWPGPAYALAPPRVGAIVVIVDDVSFSAALRVPAFRALASRGGAALMNGREDVRSSLKAASLVVSDVASLSQAVAALTQALADEEDPSIVMVISTSPGPATASRGDELGTVIMAEGSPQHMLEPRGSPKALTSDSTRRAGVVATVDPAATIAAWLGLPSDEGAPIERTDEPAPLDLYQRYLQQRRLAVPIAAGAWSFVTVAGLLGVLALVFRRRLADRALAAAGALAASLPWLALALLVVGHLPSLTGATVIPFLMAVVVAGVTFTRWVASRRGILAAIASCGAVILALLGIEAALGWPAAVTPLAGGGQLDGGRFFGMGNIEIGLVLGCGLFAAQRMRVERGTALIAACALVAGSPWTGSNVGAGITLFAAAGLWLGFRRRRRWWGIALTTGAITAAGTVLIAAMHRYLTGQPTHVTAFLERTRGPLSGLSRFVDRLGIGADLVRDNPFSLIPVVGTLVLLIVVLRPPSALARTFEAHDAWRDAVLVIVLGSIVAYLANDTGAAALGFGFGTALSGLLDVSLATAREKMDR